MRRTQLVTLTLLTAIAATACDEDLKHCVDENDVVQEETNCNVPDGGTPVNTGTPGTPGVPIHIYHWYYGGYSSPQSNGTRLSGGTYTPSAGKSYSPPSISRGGFGGTGEGFGGGAHGGGAGE